MRLAALLRLAALHADDWPALSTLLDEALALPASERDAFVDALGSEHAARREVRRTLLSRAPALETNDFLRTLPPGALPSAPPAGGQPEPGAEVGPYRLIEELGAGGIGAVWLAERRDGSPRRKVALKLPRLSWDPSLAVRSLRERDILAALEHPHIARLYDAGVDALGRPIRRFTPGVARRFPSAAMLWVSSARWAGAGPQGAAWHWAMCAAPPRRWPTPARRSWWTCGARRCD